MTGQEFETLREFRADQNRTNVSIEKRLEKLEATQDSMRVAVEATAKSLARIESAVSVIKWTVPLVIGLVGPTVLIAMKLLGG